jgi:hypothetical protein
MMMTMVMVKRKMITTKRARKSKTYAQETRTGKIAETTFEMSRRKENGIRKGGLATACTGLPP